MPFVTRILLILFTIIISLFLVLIIRGKYLSGNRENITYPTVDNIKKDDKNPNIVVGTTKIFVEIADSPEKRSKGLSGRPKLSQNEGMLFVWDKELIPTFWMKDMYFEIDIIWIKDGKVIGIEENVPKPSPGTSDNNLTLYSPHQAVDHVLEVNADFSRRHDIKIGEIVDLSQI